MQRNSDGRILPEVIILILISSSLAIFLVAAGKSRRIESGEEKAIRTLLALASAQAKSSSRPAFLDELIRTNALAQDADSPLSSMDRAEDVEGVRIHDGYCYQLFLADSAGRPHTHPGNRSAREFADFWILYAWPDRWGVTGRRLLVLDSRNALRYWNNDLALFNGPAEGPEAWLASNRQKPGERIAAPTLISTISSCCE